VGTTLTYDVENRLLMAVGEQYGYAPDNKRMWRKDASGVEKVTFWLGDGALARYTVGASSLTLDATWRYFGCRNLSVVPDRWVRNKASCAFGGEGRRSHALTRTDWCVTYSYIRWGTCATVLV